MIFFPNSFYQPARRWLAIGVLSLAIAGIFSLILVAARTPSFATIPMLNNIFHNALVAHVDLSVLIWFLSIACLIWSLAANSSHEYKPSLAMFKYAENCAQFCFVLGMILISLAPFFSAAKAIMSNYIPVLVSPFFFLGLSLVACGALLMSAKLVIKLLCNADNSCGFLKKTEIFPLAALSSAAIALVSLCEFFWSFMLLPNDMSGQQAYETGFWAGGHTLQFTHTQILLLCWVWLAHSLSASFSPPRIFLYSIFAIGVVAAITSTAAYSLYDVESAEFQIFFTDLMIGAGGIAPILLSFSIIPVLIKTCCTEKNALWTCLASSLALFIYGGILAGMISGQNVVIPAHYHGSIVGITLAFMGAAYMLLPRLGFSDAATTRAATFQPIIYAGGQFLHITGLAWSGGYGVLRKTPGAINEISTNIKIAMGIMGIGGVLAIIGGFMFVVIMLRAIFLTPSRPTK